jgi:hypothetical protein
MCVMNNSLLNIWFEAFLMDFSTYLKVTSKIYLRLPNYRTGSTTVAEFKVPDWLSQRRHRVVVPARQATVHRLAGLYDNPMPEMTIFPSQWPWIWPQLSCQETIKKPLTVSLVLSFSAPTLLSTHARETLRQSPRHLFKLCYFVVLPARQNRFPMARRPWTFMLWRFKREKTRVCN